MRLTCRIAFGSSVHRWSRTGLINGEPASVILSELETIQREHAPATGTER